MNENRRIRLNEYDASNTGAMDASYIKTEWNIENIAEKLKIVVIKNEENFMEFDMIGVDCSIANAFRRILMAEVPTMAIEKVFLYNNTSVMQDEVLAHRLGLIPIKADPRLFEYRPEGDVEGSAEDTLEFELKVRCSKKASHATKDACVPEKLYDHNIVYSGDLKFIPRGAHQTAMSGEIRPVHDDILLLKLKPGQEVDLKVHCVKGVGKDHAKFSPVAPATYRLLPEITLLKEISGDLAHRLKQCFSDGVIEIVNKKGKEVAKVASARYDTGSRNVFYDDELRDLVTMSKVKEHFIFTVESTGILSSELLFLEAVGVLEEKCRCLLLELSTLKSTSKK